MFSNYAELKRAGVRTVIVKAFWPFNSLQRLTHSKPIFLWQNQQKQKLQIEMINYHIDKWLFETTT